MDTARAMEYRRAKEADYPQIVALEESNQRATLSKDQMKDGFLSGLFDADQLDAFNCNLAVTVCEMGGAVVGFSCASTPRFNLKFGLPAAMVKCFPTLVFQGKTLDQWQPFVAGPVCIDREQRGKGILQGLYDKQFELVPPDFDLAVVLVAKENGRSLQAHYKVGLEYVSDFKFDKRTFSLLAMCRTARNPEVI